LLEIEEKRANQRQLATQNNKTGRAVRESVPPPKKDHGKSRDAVDHKIGVSGKTTKQSAVAVKVMDELAAKGKQREATQNSSIILRLIPG
jgi:hypothetical protein